MRAPGLFTIEAGIINVDWRYLLQRHPGIGCRQLVGIRRACDGIVPILHQQNRLGQGLAKIQRAVSAVRKIVAVDRSQHRQREQRRGQASRDLPAVLHAVEDVELRVEQDDGIDLQPVCHGMNHRAATHGCAQYHPG